MTIEEIQKAILKASKSKRDDEYLSLTLEDLKMISHYIDELNWLINKKEKEIKMLRSESKHLDLYI